MNALHDVTVDADGRCPNHEKWCDVQAQRRRKRGVSLDDIEQRARVLPYRLTVRRVRGIEQQLLLSDRPHLALDRRPGGARIGRLCRCRPRDGE